MTLYFAAGRRSGDLAGFMSRSAGFDSPARYYFAPVRDLCGRPLAPVTNTACLDRGTSLPTEGVRP